MEEGSYASLERNTKCPVERQSVSDYGTMKVRAGDRMRLNMTIPSNRKNGKISMLPGYKEPLRSTSSNETTVDVIDEFVLAMDNPVENQRNFDDTLRIGEDDKKKF